MRAGRLMRAAIGALALAGAPAAATAASYEEARDAFETSFDRQQRLTAQVLLSAAGYLAAVPTGSLSRGTYEAVKAFEVQNGYAASGLIDRRQFETLAIAASPTLRLWGFRKTPYPGRPIAIWVPDGLGLASESAATGLHFRDPRGRLTLDLISVQQQSLQVAHAAQLADSVRHEAIVRDDDFSVGDAWFALSSQWPDGTRHDVRLYQDGAGVIGFCLTWHDGAEGIEPERIAAIMAGSLRAAVLGEPFPDPPRFIPSRGPLSDAHDR